MWSLSLSLCVCVCACARARACVSVLAAWNKALAKRISKQCPHIFANSIVSANN